MKKSLFLLMMVVSVASAHPRSDSLLKDLITAGAWTYDNGRVAAGKSAKEFTYHPNGILNMDVEGSAVMKWDIKNGKLIETDLDDPNQSVSIILFLTKHELLLQDTKDKSYTFMYR